MTATPKSSEIISKPVLPKDIGTDWNFKHEIVWPNAIGFLILHLMSLYGFYLVFASAKLSTTLWAIGVAAFASEGITMGAHRMYTHKAFKATLPVRFLLMVAQTIAGQNCCWVWVRDHRLHHKYSDTDADPHNATRGFFFSHIGWLMTKKHPLVIQKGREIDMTDINADGLVMFQKKYYKTLYYVFAFVLPIFVPCYFFNETLANSFFVAFIFRYVYQLNITWCINSVTHLWGYKPYDQKILPVENDFINFLALGEGAHNYHHAFPHDYRAAELIIGRTLTTSVIDLFAYFGGVYDLKVATPELIQMRAKKYGDGTYYRNTSDNDIKQKTLSSVYTTIYKRSTSRRG